MSAVIPTLFTQLVCPAIPGCQFAQATALRMETNKCHPGLPDANMNPDD